MTSTLLISPHGRVDILPPSTLADDALGGHLYRSQLCCYKTLFWSSCLSGEVNELASRLVGHPVTGDVCLVDTSGDPAALSKWLQRFRKHLVRMSHVAPPSPTRRQRKMPRNKRHAIHTTQPSSPKQRQTPESCMQVSPPAHQTSAASPRTAAVQHPPPPPPPHHSKHAWRHQPISNTPHSSSSTQHTDPRQALLWSIAGQATSLSWGGMVKMHHQGVDHHAPSGDGAAAESSDDTTDAHMNTQKHTADKIQLQEVVTPCCQGGDDQPIMHDETSPCNSISTSQHIMMELMMMEHMMQHDDNILHHHGQQQHEHNHHHPHPYRHDGWADLHPDLLGVVLSLLVDNLAHVTAAAGVCSKWRHAFLQDTQHLRLLQCGLPSNDNDDENNNDKNNNNNKKKNNNNTSWVYHQPPNPMGSSLVHAAAAAGSVSANMLLGHVQDARGDPEGALRYYRAAASRGHPIAQVIMGCSYYGAHRGAAPDPEAAMLWLGRGAKQLLLLVNQHTHVNQHTRMDTEGMMAVQGNEAAESSNRSNGGMVNMVNSNMVNTTNSNMCNGVDMYTTTTTTATTATLPALSAACRHDLMYFVAALARQLFDTETTTMETHNTTNNTDTTNNTAPTPLFPTTNNNNTTVLAMPGCARQPLRMQEACAWLAVAALLLGYVHLDGEGGRVDRVEAIRWFKVAVQHGSVEGERVLGSLYNTGQFA